MNNAYWIWFPGDLEIHYGMKQNFSREERGFRWPAYWKIDDCRKNVNFRNEYELQEKTKFKVCSHSVGYVLVNEKKYPFGKTITCDPGKVMIVVHAADINAFPSVYIEGSIIYSNCEWLADDYVCEPVKVGWNTRYTKAIQNPAVWEYDSQVFIPERIREVSGGVLYKFPVQITATLKLKFKGQFIPVHICYGETEAEALDVENCYYSQWVSGPNKEIPIRAFRYIFIPKIRNEMLHLEAIHRYVNIPIRASFDSDNDKLNKIWETSVWTFRLCSGIFFIDGVKRDRWIWSGDAYQAYFVNQYLMADPEIDQRTILALRGNDPMDSHINTILDYSLLWIIGIYQHYQAYGDYKFIEMVYPKMVSLMMFCDKQLDKQGFLVGRERDWTFIDWGVLDKVGAVCAEQILFVHCFQVMEECSRLLGIEETEYEKRKYELQNKIQLNFWDEEKGAFIDSYTSGKRYVSRQTNIFAVLYGIADQRQTASICKKVLRNTEIPAITTPYFKFYEMEALCISGFLKEVYHKVLEYWGGMLEYDTTTFWEEYDRQNLNHLEMYGDPYGKSMCHAWAASPIYLIGRYFIGIRPTAPGYETYEIRPVMELLGDFQAKFPIGKGEIVVGLKKDVFYVETNKFGGILHIKDKDINLLPGQVIEVDMKFV